MEEEDAPAPARAFWQAFAASLATVVVFAVLVFGVTGLESHASAGALLGAFVGLFTAALALAAHWGGPPAVYGVVAGFVGVTGAVALVLAWIVATSFT